MHLEQFVRRFETVFQGRSEYHVAPGASAETIATAEARLGIDGVKSSTAPQVFELECGCVVPINPVD